MDTRQQIIALADRLTRTQGPNGWSYADIAKGVGIRKASVHHHFPAKADLLRAVIDLHRRLAETFTDLPGDGAAVLRLFMRGYDAQFDGESLCACGSLTADLMVLPPAAQADAIAYVRGLTTWLEGVIERGQLEETISRAQTPEATAALILGALQGGLQRARALGDRGQLQTVIAFLETSLLESPC